MHQLLMNSLNNAAANIQSGEDLIKKATTEPAATPAATEIKNPTPASAPKPVAPVAGAAGKKTDKAVGDQASKDAAAKKPTTPAKDGAKTAKPAETTAEKKPEGDSGKALADAKKANDDAKAALKKAQENVDTTAKKVKEAEANA